MLEAITLILNHQFLQRALIVGVLISLCCALLGVSLVLKRFSMIGDGLSHVGFGAMAIACAANVAPLYFSLPIVLASAFLLLRMNEKGKIKGDAAIALISTGALAVGVMVTSMTTGMNVDIYNYMFGSVLTMTDGDVIIATVVSVVIIMLFVLFYDEIFAVTFDENFAQATGTKTSFYNMLIAGLTAITIVIGMRMMGALLISSLIIFPTVTSMRVCKSFRSVVVSSALISIVCFFFGLIFSVGFEAPTGASIVCVNIYAFIMFSLVAKIKSTALKISVRKILTVFMCTVFLAAPLVLNLFSSDFGSDKNGVSVVATTFAPYDFSREIVGDRGEVLMLLSPGEESHTYEPTPTDIMKIRQCDVFVYGGGESEKWVDEILESIDSDIAVVKMMDVSTLEESEHDHEHEHSSNIHGGEYDEHVWTSPLNAIKIVTAISEAVCGKDASNIGSYKDNSEKLIKKLNELDAQFRSLAELMRDKTVVIGDRFPLRYLMLEYGIEYSSAFPGCSAQVEVNPVTLANLIDFVKSNSLKKVFKVDLGTGNVASLIAESTGAQVDTLYSCHVISADDFENGESYISLMLRNLKALQTAVY